MGSEIKGIRNELIPLENGEKHPLKIISFRSLEMSHSQMVTDELISRDRPVAFHGWGVTGIAGRVDERSEYRKFWTIKEGRPQGSKIPLLEPPEEIVRHVDWSAVHPELRFLKDANALKELLWGGKLPFHVIFPYNASGSSLPDVVITPPNDPDVAPEINFPSFCSFRVEDPSTINLLEKIKQENPWVQLGVSSLNDHGKQPPYNTSELIEYLKGRSRIDFDIVIEDPLLEGLDIASSHSQIKIPLVGEEPVWVMKRVGSLSAKGFQSSTGFQVRLANGDDTRVASRRAAKDVDLDDKLYTAARLMNQWRIDVLKGETER